MKMIHGIALPDADTHFAAMIEANPLFEGKGTYQFGNLKPAVEICTKHRLAVDVGAHIGTWSRVLAHMFDEVVAFEPLPTNVECFKANTVGLNNVSLHPWAVGKYDGGIYVSTVSDNSGNAHIDEQCRPFPESFYRPCTTLDDMNWPTPVDFLKIDVEGYELFVIQGAEQTIKRDRPIIVCEQKPANSARYGLGEMDAVNLLCSWGYHIAWSDGEDYVCAV